MRVTIQQACSDYDDGNRAHGTRHGSDEAPMALLDESQPGGPAPRTRLALDLVGGWRDADAVTGCVCIDEGIIPVSLPWGHVCPVRGVARCAAPRQVPQRG